MTSPWWLTKVAVGLALVVYSIASAAGYGLDLAGRSVPLLLGQTLVLLGACLHLGHYAVLRRGAGGDIGEPEQLVTDVGLFRFVRHPMYLGDVVIYTGLALLAPDPLAFGLLLMGLVAIERQSRLEDRELTARFGGPFEAWRKRTRLLLPGLY